MLSSGRRWFSAVFACLDRYVFTYRPMLYSGDAEGADFREPLVSACPDLVTLTANRTNRGRGMNWMTSSGGQIDGFISKKM